MRKIGFVFLFMTSTLMATPFNLDRLVKSADEYPFLKQQIDEIGSFLQPNHQSFGTFRIRYN